MELMPEFHIFKVNDVIGEYLKYEKQARKKKKIPAFFDIAGSFYSAGIFGNGLSKLFFHVQHNTCRSGTQC